MTSRFPKKMCEAVRQGLKREINLRKGRLIQKCSIESKVEKRMQSVERCAENGGTAREICSLVHGGERCWDDVRGGWLDIRAVKEARNEGMMHVKKFPVYRKVSRSVARDCGQAIIPVRWVDTNTSQ